MSYEDRTGNARPGSGVILDFSATDVWLILDELMCSGAAFASGLFR